MDGPRRAYAKVLGDVVSKVKRERAWFHTLVATTITFLALAAATQLGLLG